VVDLQRTGKQQCSGLVQHELSCELAEQLQTDFCCGQNGTPCVRVGASAREPQPRRAAACGDALDDGRRWQVIRGQTGAEPCEKRVTALDRSEQNKNCVWDCKMSRKNVLIFDRQGRCRRPGVYAPLPHASPCSLVLPTRLPLQCVARSSPSPTSVVPASLLLYLFPPPLPLFFSSLEHHSKKPEH
jgi:hypothetical protein